MWPLYGVETWPQIRSLSTILNGHAVGTDVSVRYRQGGRTLEVVVKRGSTVMTDKIDQKYFKFTLYYYKTCPKTTIVQDIVSNCMLLNKTTSKIKLSNYFIIIS